MNKLTQIIIACAGTMAIAVVGTPQAWADTLTVTSTNNMTKDSSPFTGDSVTDSLMLASSDNSFQRNGTDAASFTYTYQGQASADGASCWAAATGYLNFSFSLIPAIWKITARPIYAGAVAVSNGYGNAGSSDLVLSSGGAASGLSWTMLGATRTTTGGTTFDRKIVFPTLPPAIQTTTTGSGYVRLTFDYGVQNDGTAESYVCLGQASPLSSFALDATWYDLYDGVGVALTFTPTLTFTGQTANWDLAMVSGETLGGYGTINGDVTCTSGGIIHPTDTGLVIGDSASSTGFNFGGTVEVTEGNL